MDFGPDDLLAAARFHIGAAAHDANDRIIYNPATGFLLCDLDGTGQAQHAFHFATLAPYLHLHSTDFLVASIIAA